MNSNPGGPGLVDDEGKLPQNRSPQGPGLLSERPTLVGVSGSKRSVTARRTPATSSKSSLVYLMIVLGSLIAPLTGWMIILSSRTPVPLRLDSAPISSPAAVTQHPPKDRSLPVQHGQELCVLAPAPTASSDYRDPDVEGPLDVSHNGKMVAVRVQGGGIGLWDTTSGKLLRILVDRSHRYNSILFSSDDQTLIVGREDGIVEIWNLRKGNFHSIRHLRARNGLQIALSADGKTVATAGSAYIGGRVISDLKLWDVQTGHLKRILSENGPSLFSPRFSLDGTRLIAIASQKSIASWNSFNSALLDWDLRSDGPPLRVSLPHRRITGAAISPDDGTLAVGTFDDSRTPTTDRWNRKAYCGDIQLLDSHTGALLRTIDLPDYLGGLAYGKDSRTLRQVLGDHIEIQNLDSNERQVLLLPNSEATSFDQGLTYSIVGGYHGPVELVRIL